MGLKNEFKDLNSENNIGFTIFNDNKNKKN